MNRALIDFWVGLFVAMGIAAIVFIALRVADLTDASASDSYEVNARFDNIGDLKLRAPVKSAGVVIGRVTDIDFDSSDYKAVVTVSIENRYNFSIDSSMSVLTTGVLGEQYIGIQTGAEEDMLKNGDSIWLTSSAVILENLVSELLFNTASKPKE